MWAISMPLCTAQLFRLITQKRQNSNLKNYIFWEEWYQSAQKHLTSTQKRSRNHLWFAYK